MMDHSIKKKPEKPRMRRLGLSTNWVCHDNEIMVMLPCGVTAYKEWQRTRAALNKIEVK